MKIPSKFEELTINHLIAFAGWDGDYADLLQRWTGEDYDLCLNELDRLPANYFDYLNQGNIYERLNAINCPKSIKIEGKKVLIPDDLAVESFGKKMMLKNLMQVVNLSDDKELEILKQMNTAVSVYLCDRYYSTFDSSKIEEFKEKIAEIPAVEIYPVARFFFRLLMS